MTQITHASTTSLYLTLTTPEEVPALGWNRETLQQFLADETTTVSMGEAYPTRDVLVATQGLPAGAVIVDEWVTLRSVPLDPTSEQALQETEDALGGIAAIDILPRQLITPNLLEWIAGDRENGYGLFVSEYLAGATGTLGMSLPQFVKRWNKAAKDWPDIEMRKRPIVEELQGKGRDFVRWFGRSDAEVGVMGFIRDGDISTAQLAWLPLLDDSNDGAPDAEKALKAFLMSTNPRLTKDAVAAVMGEPGWDPGARSYLDVESQGSMKGLLYTLASYVSEGDEYVTVVARADDTTDAP